MTEGFFYSFWRNSRIVETTSLAVIARINRNDTMVDCKEQGWTQTGKKKRSPHGMINVSLMAETTWKCCGSVEVLYWDVCSWIRT